jgi:asparagine synthase (glutamine-hydrolysing)
MCRIAGIADKHLPIDVLYASVEAMCMMQQHGGPDDQGLFTDEPYKLVLGNRRLSLIDLRPEGHMPMSYNQSYHITYNGELYNFQSLRDELKQLGHQFSSKTDTEVILAAYAQWGELAFGRLQGMFAFALWDQQAGDLFLVRDPAGIKPLYYRSTDAGLQFASEVRAFRCVTETPDLNKNWPVYMMAYGHLPEPVTRYADVTPLPKGFFLKCNLASYKTSLQSFAHYSFSSDTKAGTAQSFRSIAADSVSRHLVADAPIGVFLSGGLDSGIIASLAAHTKGKDLNTLSIYFEETAFSEKKYQDLMVERLNSRHHQLLLTAPIFEESLTGILEAMDLPSCDGINTWFISKLAAQHGIKAVLSGLGGDELFGGYPSFQRMQAATMLQSLPNGLLGVWRKTANKRLGRMAYLRMSGTKGLYLFLRGHFTPYEIAKQLDASEKEIWQLLEDMPVYPMLYDTADKNRASWMEFNVYMQNQLLRDADVMSMAHGVEIRVPFLDDQLIRWTLRMKPAIKFKNGLPKQFLIDCFNDLIPEPVWNRPKMGFSFPFERWLTQSALVAEWMNQSSSNTQQAYQRFLNGQLHWSQLMCLIILQKNKPTLAS